MTAGDPKKAVVLGVVAVAILGVAVFRIIPRPDSGPIAGDAAASVEPQKDVVKRGVDRQLRRNPFFHPGLDAAAVIAPRAGSAPEPNGTEPLALPPLEGGGFPGRLPGAVGVRPGPAEGSKPAENTGSRQQEKQKRKVVLNAVIEVARTFAYMTVNGDEFRVGVGDELPGVGSVVSITGKGVVVKTAHGRVSIPVGESVEI